MAKPSRKAHEHNKTFFTKPAAKLVPDYRDELRDRLAADTEEFLKRGGKIKVIESKDNDRGGCSHWGGVL